MLPPLNLPTHCDGCDKKFSLSHASECKIGRLITDQHDEVRDKLGQVGAQAYTKSAVCDKPYIDQVRIAERKQRAQQTTSDQRRTRRQS
eukprot:9005516-Ditylum_brightwellii.AAC.1